MSLLDELKKAGLANDKKAKQIEREKKQQKHHELKSGESRKQVEASRADESRPVDAVMLETSQAAKQTEQLARIYKNAEVTNASGRKKFYFTTIDNYIECMNMSDVASILLERGKYAIVANESLDDYIVVKRATALALESIDKRRVVVLHRTEC